MTTSVIIATYNRAPLLRECLEHLTRQAFEPGDEIIIVDNGSTDATSRVIEMARTSCVVPIQHLEEPAPGKSRALAHGLEHASGDVLAFTDDDVNVDDIWLESIRTAMVDESIALLGGPVAPRWERPAPRWLRASASAYDRLTAPIALLDYGTVSADLGARTVLGANLAIRRRVLQQVGGFAPHLGKLRGTQLSGEDDDLCRRVRDAGLRARYCPDVRVRHFVPADRMRVGYYLSWFFWYGITHAALDADRRRSERSIAGVPLYLVKRAATSGVQAMAAAVVGNLPGSIERAIDVAFATGYAASRLGLAPTSARSRGGPPP
jgi:GT2 family glycosyltransferase